MVQPSEEAMKIAKDFVGKYPDSSNKPSWDEIRESCAAEIDFLTNSLIVDVLNQMANQIIVQIQSQKLSAYGKYGALSAVEKPSVTAMKDAIIMYSIPTLRASLTMIKDKRKPYNDAIKR